MRILAFLSTVLLASILALPAAADAPLPSWRAGAVAVQAASFVENAARPAPGGGAEGELSRRIEEAIDAIAVFLAGDGRGVEVRRAGEKGPKNVALLHLQAVLFAVGVLAVLAVCRLIL